MQIPVFDPIESGWFERGTPIDYERRDEVLCSRCGELTPHDFYKAIVGVNAGFRLPFGRRSTAGKLGTRSRWSFCAVCGSVSALDEAAEAALRKAGIKQQAPLNEIVDALVAGIVTSVGDASFRELDEIAPDRPPANMREWLIANTFCVARGLTLAYGSPQPARALLDPFHARVVALHASTLEEAKELERLIGERYAQYFPAVADGTSTNFAAMVTENVWHSTDAVLMFYAARVASERTIAMHGLGTSIKDCELV